MVGMGGSLTSRSVARYCQIAHAAFSFREHDRRARLPLHLVPRRLLYFEAVAAHGSIQAASRALGIAASAIDRQILALEAASEMPLFERLPRGMRLTAAGESVLVVVRRWQADADRLETALREMRGLEHGKVHLAAMDSLANGLLPGFVERLADDHPRLRLTVSILAPEPAARALEEGTVDVAMVFNLTESRDHHAIWKTELPFGCACAPTHQLAGRSELTLREIAGHPVVAQSRLLPIRRYLDRQVGWLFTEEEPKLVTNSLQLLKQVLVQGRHLLLTSELDVLPELEEGALVFVPLRERKLTPQTVSIAISSSRALSRAAQTASELLIAMTSERLRAVR